MATAEEGAGSAQPPNRSSSKRAASDDQLSTPSTANFKRSKSLGLKSLFVGKVRGVRNLGKQSLNKFGRHLSASDQSDLAALTSAPRLLSVSSIDSDDDIKEREQHRLVRTNAFKVYLSVTV